MKQYSDSKIIIFSQGHKTLPEIFEFMRDTDKETQIKILRSFASNKVVKWYVDAVFVTDWKYFQQVDYKPNPAPVGICYGSINTKLGQINSVAQLYELGNDDRANFILKDILESISAPESELLCSIFKNEKKLPCDKSVFREVFPDTFRFLDSEEKNEEVVGEQAQ